MWTRKMVVLLCLAGMCLSGVALGDAKLFRNGGGDQLWGNPANWDAVGLPSLADSAIITHDVSGWSPTIGAPGAMCFELNIAPWGAPAYVTVDAAGDLTSQYVKIGTGGATGAGTFSNSGTVSIINAGQVRVAADVAGSIGIVNTYAGSSMSGSYLLTLATADATAQAELNMFGGTVSTDLLNVGAGATVNIHDGTLIFLGSEGGMVGPGSAEAYVDQLIASGNLIGYDGDGWIERYWDNDLWRCVVTAQVPEPATLVLLAVGGLLAARKRS